MRRVYWILILLAACESQKLAQRSENAVVKAQSQVAQQAAPQLVSLAERPPAARTVASNIKSVPAHNFYFMLHKSADDGLALDTVRCSYKDKAGNLWFGTLGGGVSRFDGRSFTTFSEVQGLVNNSVQAIAEDKSGAMWFGTVGGVSRFDGKSFQNFGVAQGLLHEDIAAIFEDSKGHLWFGSAQGVSEYDGNTMRNYGEAQGLVNRTVISIAQDAQGDLWFGTLKGVSRFDGKHFQNLSVKDGLVGDDVRSILVSKAGEIWFGTASGVSRLSKGRFVSFTTKDGLVNNDVFSVIQDRDGRIWFATSGGASVFDSGTFTNLTKKEGLSADLVQSVVEDEGGHLWFGTKGGGVSVFAGTAFTNFGAAQGMPNALVYNIIKDHDQNLWFGTDGGGVVKYDGQVFTAFGKAQGVGTDRVWGLLEDREHNIWLGSLNQGVIKYDGHEFTRYSVEQGLPDTFVRAALEDSEGRLWFGTGSGLSRFDGKQIVNYKRAQGLPNDDVFALLEDRNHRIWIGTNNGVSAFDGTTFHTFNEKTGFPATRVNQIFQDDAGNLWFATSRGIIRYDGKHFLSLRLAQGLPANEVPWIAQGPEGRILIGTNKGLAVLNGFDDPQTNQHLAAQNAVPNKVLERQIPDFEIYNTDTGYPVKDANVGSYLIDNKGVAWFGTGSSQTGLVRFDYRALRRNQHAPKVWLQGVTLDNAKVAWYALAGSPSPWEESLVFGHALEASERQALRTQFSDIERKGVAAGNPIPQDLKLPFVHNNITVSFAAIEPSYPQNVLYQYKLSHYQNEWSAPTNQTWVNFNNLFENRYVFSVRAKRPDSDWGPVTTFAFQVYPPWFRTWWAYSLYGITFLSCFYAFYLWRTAALRKRQRELEHLYESAERFLPKDFIRMLGKEYVQDVKLGDSVEVDFTIMFADIRKFTTLSEQLGHHKTSMVLNHYMSLMAPSIRKFQGMVGQFLGDGILAFFRLDAQSAIQASFEMRKQLPVFNEYLAKQGVDPVEIGIALNAGPSIFGITGEEKRLQATIISDDVNLASRVESLNKVYKTGILITGSVYDRVADRSRFLSVLIDKVIVVGQTRVVRIYAVWPLVHGPRLAEAQQFLSRFSEGFGHYERAEFAKAEQIFEACQAFEELRGSAQVLIERCQHFQKEGTPSEWDGTVRLSEK